LLFVKYNKIHDKDKLRVFLLTVILLNGLFSRAQLFDNPANLKLVGGAVEYIYNIRPDTTAMYIDSVQQILPNHPIVPTMKALSLLWVNIPVVTVDSVFDELNVHLRETIKLAQKMDGGRQEHPEAIFFEMSARGLLAEYYADQGHYMKALNEASQAYELVKSGFKLTEEIPDFLTTTGIYNYFREKYPERHPVYKPLVWFFKSGDLEAGIEQLDQATRFATLTHVEASVYLAYIYLRYEYQPEKAQAYLHDLTEIYPRNLYVKAKLLESLVPGNSITMVSKETLEVLMNSDRPYYRMAGRSFNGLYVEKTLKKDEEAIANYNQAIKVGEEIEGHGEYYRDLAYLGLGRIYSRQDNAQAARFNLQYVLDHSDAEDLLAEANDLLDQLD
jgi:hypothetical protein